MHETLADHPAAQRKSHTIPPDLASIEDSLIEITNIYGEKLAKIFDLGNQLTDLPEGILCLIKRFAEQERAEARLYTATQRGRHTATQRGRRCEERAPCASSAIAVPVNSQFVRSGEPFVVTIRDLSEHGIRLLYTRSVNAKYLALRWEAKSSPRTWVRVVARILRCDPKGPFYDLVGEFVLAD